MANVFKARREELKGSVLCADHASYYALFEPDVTIAAEPKTDDEPIECECCSMAAMRAAGAI